MAASNTSTGPMMAFAGMNMANMVGGINAGQLYQMDAQQNSGMQQAQAAPAQGQAPKMQAPVLGWTCSCGATDNRGKFCAECGAPKPSDAGWTCSCGAVNQGKFCSECGARSRKEHRSINVINAAGSRKILHILLSSARSAAILLMTTTEYNTYSSEYIYRKQYSRYLYDICCTELL